MPLIKGKWQRAPTWHPLEGILNTFCNNTAFEPVPVSSAGSQQIVGAEGEILIGFDSEKEGRHLFDQVRNSDTATLHGSRQ